MACAVKKLREEIFKKLLKSFRSFLVDNLAKDHEIALRKGPLDLSERQIQEHVKALKREYEESDELEENIHSWLEDYKLAEVKGVGGVPEIETIERGWPGHFIAADRCMFNRNTLVRYGDKKAVVSTVGRYFPKDSDEVEEIGRGRYFETMAFWADDTKFSEADIFERFALNGKTSIGHAKPYADIEADAMHDKRVKEVKGKLRNEYQAREEGT